MFLKNVIKILLKRLPLNKNSNSYINFANPFLSKDHYMAKFYIFILNYNGIYRNLRNNINYVNLFTDNKKILVVLKE